jgi:hypothetical protein
VLSVRYVENDLWICGRGNNETAEPSPCIIIRGRCLCAHERGSFFHVSFLASTVAPTPLRESVDRSAQTPAPFSSPICDGDFGVPQSEMSDLYATRRLSRWRCYWRFCAPDHRRASGLIWLRVNGHSFNAITAHKLYLDLRVVLDYTFWQWM